MLFIIQQIRPIVNKKYEKPKFSKFAKTKLHKKQKITQNNSVSKLKKGGKKI